MSVRESFVFNKLAKKRVAKKRVAVSACFAGCQLVGKSAPASQAVSLANLCIAEILPPFGRLNDGLLRIRKARYFYRCMGNPLVTPSWIILFLPFLSGYQVGGRDSDNGWQGLSY